MSNAAAFCAFPIGCVSANPDYFVASFNSNGTALRFATYFDGTGGIAVAPDGSPYVAAQNAVFKLSPDGSAIVSKSVPLGQTNALAIASDGNLYGAGTTSFNLPFPATPGAFQTAAVNYPIIAGGFVPQPGTNGFIAKLDPALNLLAGTFYGGEAFTAISSIALSPNGRVLVGGATSAYALPMRNTIWAPFSLNTGYIAEFSPDLSTLTFATYAGNSDGFSVRAVAYGAKGNLLLAGATPTTPRTWINAFYPIPSSPQIDRVVNAASRQSVALSATVPTGIADAYANIEVRNNGQTSNAVLFPVARAAPGIYSQNGTGCGQGYILNQDGTLNTPINPALEGSPITIFATGVGPMTFVGPYAVTDNPVGVFIDGFYANGIAALSGPVPGLPGYVYRIGVFVPHPADNAANNPNLKGFNMPPLVSVRLVVNGIGSQAGLSISVTRLSGLVANKYPAIPRAIRSSCCSPAGSILWMQNTLTTTSTLPSAHSSFLASPVRISTLDSTRSSSAFRRAASGVLPVKSFVLQISIATTRPNGTRSAAPTAINPRPAPRSRTVSSPRQFRCRSKWSRNLCFPK